MGKSIKTKWVDDGHLLRDTFIMVAIPNMSKKTACFDLASEKGDSESIISVF